MKEIKKLEIVNKKTKEVENVITDKVEVLERFAEIMQAKYIDKASYIGRVVRKQHYSHLTITATYNNKYLFIFTLED